MRRLVKYISAWTVQPWIRKRMTRSSMYTYKGVRLFIPAGVFHPGYFFSTKFLLQHVLTLDLSNRSLLELGAGNGLISITAAKHGAHVTASDINSKALEAIVENARENNTVVETVYSDLFENMHNRDFDLIIINPPFYPQNPRNDLERAWYAGEDHLYFRSLFQQLPAYITSKTIVRMILSEDCDISRIQTLANAEGLTMSVSEKKRIFREWNMIYSITKI